MVKTRVAMIAKSKNDVSDACARMDKFYTSPAT